MIFIFYFIQSIFSKITNDKSIRGSIISNWTIPPAISELLAFVQDIDHAAYWDMIESLSTQAQMPKTKTEVVSFAKHFLNEEQIPLFNFSLNIHYYSPRIEFFKSIIDKNENDYLILCGNSIKSKIPNDNDFCQTQIQSYEPIFGNGESVIALYINSDSPPHKWSNIYHDLQKRDDTFKFVVRFVGFSKHSMLLNGYGVHLKPFKYSMEFNKNDESHLIKSTNKTVNQKDFDQFGLKTDKDFDLEINTSKVNLDKLPFQFCQFLKNSKDAINAIREVTTNFPIFAEQIRRTTVDDSAIRSFNRSPQFLSPGQTSLFINGRSLSQNDLSIHSIYEALLEEYRTNQMLIESFEFDDDSINIFRKSGNSNVKLTTNQIPMIDARSDLFVFWMNNPEADEKYTKKYPKSLFVFSNENDKLPLIARNVFNAIFILDPSDPDDLNTLNVLQDLIDQQYPVRFGYIIAPVKRSPVAKKIYYGYAHIALKYGMKAAHKFLTKVNDMREMVDGKLGSIKPNMWANAYGSIAIDRRSPSFKTINDLFKSKTDETRFIQRLNEHINNIGVSVPSMIFNGKIVEEKHPERYIQSLIDEEVINIRDLIGKRKLTDATKDIHDLILSQKGVYKRYNKKIQSKSNNNFAETIRIQQECIQNQRQFIKWMKSIKYQYGTSSCAKLQSFWIFNNADETHQKTVKRQVDMFMSEIAKIDQTRLAYFDINETKSLPKAVLRLLNLYDDKVTIVFNGRIVRIDQNSFTRFDLELIQEWEMPYSTDFAKSYQEKSSQKLTLGISRPVRDISDSVLYMSMIASTLSHSNTSRTGQPYKSFKSRGINLYRAPKNSSMLTVYLVFNPFAVEGKRLTCILSYLKQFNFGLMINPPLQLAKLENEFDSLFSFYSNVDEDGFFTLNSFNESTTYSIIPDIPLTWQLNRKEAQFDFDNVIADQLSSGTHECQYELNSILVEGSVIDVEGYGSLDEIEEGIELTLFTINNRKVDETRCISRNGYYQLRSAPGQYFLRTNTKEQFTIVCDSFFSSFNFISCHKSVEVEYTNLTNGDNKIHIFIVASGHLYERLERIMMLSAVKHTTHTVKFWILENFVSPQHRHILSIISSKYKFEYEFCRYNWPSWMNQEDQRQRLFWGYKILFLDVMFPNNLKRVIYVDADDVIRADFYELMTIDLKGAPYAFTPFCNDRPEMEEYMFWNDGYWRNLLNGKKYHISALFVIDLHQFRRKKIGDLIRKAYLDLANDKLSLSNLDQDLPNLLQTKGAEIFSLPQEWLWCGSWCSDSTMAKAKTIDLCNNPRTKESKLEYAKKTIPEWKPLDAEINSEFVIDDL